MANTFTPCPNATAWNMHSDNFPLAYCKECDVTACRECHAECYTQTWDYREFGHKPNFRRGKW